MTVIFEPVVSSEILHTLDTIAFFAEGKGAFRGKTLIIEQCSEGQRIIPCLKERREFRLFGWSLYRKDTVLLAVDNMLHAEVSRRTADKGMLLSDRKLRIVFFDRRIKDIAQHEFVKFAKTIGVTLEYRELFRLAGA